jgi:hypothetical protein
MSHRFSGSLQAVCKTVRHIPLLYVQWNTPDDKQRNCPKYVEFHSKNKFEKLVHLIGFNIQPTGLSGYRTTCINTCCWTVFTLNLTALYQVGTIYDTDWDDDFEKLVRIYSRHILIYSSICKEALQKASGKPLSGPRFNPRTFRIWIRSNFASPATLFMNFLTWWDKSLATYCTVHYGYSCITVVHFKSRSSICLDRLSQAHSQIQWWLWKVNWITGRRN